MSTELLPCPFCSTEQAKIYEDTSSDNRSNWAYEVECQNCGVSTKWCSTEDAAIEVWNRRTAASAEQTTVSTKLDLSGLTRYDHESYESPVPYPDGRYVLLEDVQALVASYQPPQQPSAAPESEQKPAQPFLDDLLATAMDERYEPRDRLQRIVSRIRLAPAESATLSEESILAIADETGIYRKNFAGFTFDPCKLIPFARAMAAAGNSQSQDAARLEFMAEQNCFIDSGTSINGKTSYWLVWPSDGSVQKGAFESPAAAIDAAMCKQEGEEGA